MVIVLIIVPLVVFLCVLVAMWWCLFRYNNSKRKTRKEPKDRMVGLEIAKTASKEESDGVSPSIGFAASVLTEKPFGVIEEEEDNSPKGKKLSLSSRWGKTDEENFEEYDYEGGVANSVDSEDLTFDERFPGTGAAIAARTPTRTIKSFLSRKSLSASPSPKKVNEIPAEIFSGQMDFNELESHRDDESNCGLDSLASHDVYTT
jgi:hypothetical protein